MNNRYDTDIPSLKTRINMIGPKAPATFSVPFFWKIKSRKAMMLAMIISVICFVSFKTPNKKNTFYSAEYTYGRRKNAISTRREMPIKSKDCNKYSVSAFPDVFAKVCSQNDRASFAFSPRLIASHPYSIETSIVNVQTMRERTPITLSYVGFSKRNITVKV